MSEQQKMYAKLAALFGITAVIAVGLFVLFTSGGPQITETPTPETPSVGSGSLPGSGVRPPGGTGGNGTDPGGPTTPGQLPVADVAQGGVTATNVLTTGAVVSPTPTTDGISYYDPADGRFYTINTDGDVERLGDVQFPDADNIVFSPTANQVAVEFPDGSNVIYDFTTASQVSLPAHWEEFDFSNDGLSVVSKSIGNDASNRALVISSTDGSQTSVIAALGENDDLVDVSMSPNSSVVGFSRTGGGGDVFGENTIYLLGPNGEASGALFVNGTNFKNIWSPDGTNLLYSVADAGDNYRPSLWYADSRGDRAGESRMKIDLKTVVEKCVFASESLAYCSAQNNAPAGSGNLTTLLSGPDNLYKVNLSSGLVTLIAEPEDETVMNNLSISSDGANIFYTDAGGRLGTIRLK